MQKGEVDGRVAGIAVFGDSGDVSEIAKFITDPTISGITTNPALVAASGVVDYQIFCRELCRRVEDKCLSLEVLSEDFAEIEQQALWLARLSKHVVVKIPIRTTAGQSTLPLVAHLSRLGVRVNVTAVFDADECRHACEALASGSGGIVSLFAGRLADIGHDPEPTARRCADHCRRYGTSLLWASAREVFNVIQAERSGCDIITLTGDLLARRSRLHRPVAEMASDTVRMLVEAGRGLQFSYGEP